MSYKQNRSGERGRHTETWRNEPTGYHGGRGMTSSRQAQLDARRPFTPTLPLPRQMGAAAPTESYYYEYEAFLDELEEIRRKYTKPDTPTVTPTDTGKPPPTVQYAVQIAALVKACKKGSNIGPAVAILKALPEADRTRVGASAAAQGADIGCLRAATLVILKEERATKQRNLLLAVGAIAIGSWLIFKK